MPSIFVLVVYLLISCVLILIDTFLAINIPALSFLMWFNILDLLAAELMLRTFQLTNFRFEILCYDTTV